MNLKDMRRAKKMTCAELAAACGVSIPTIRAYESGARMMSAETLYLISQALDVTMDSAYQAYIQRRKKGANT